MSENITTAFIAFSSAALFAYWFTHICRLIAAAHKRRQPREPEAETPLSRSATAST
jgi:hypothetical protein